MAESADLQKLCSGSLQRDWVIREGWFGDVGVLCGDGRPCGGLWLEVCFR